MLKLFLIFFKIGLFTFGGGYAMIPLISEELNFFNISPTQFSNFIAISESTPGPFAINIATFIGYNHYGILGAIIATIGVTLPSFIVMLLIAIFINKIKNTRFFKTFIKFATPVILGLILSSTIKIFNSNLFNIESLFTINDTFSLNLLTLITLIILIISYLIFYLLKKKKPSPFLLIGISFAVGVTSYFIDSFLLTK